VRGRRKNFGRDLRPLETQIQAAVVDHWRILGLPNTLVAAIPNAGAHGQPGLTKGLADLLVIGPDLPGEGSAGFMELKRDEYAKRTDSQWEFARLCADLDIPYAVTFGRDQPIRILELWGVVRRAAA
jgi:hypothetical protein